MWKRFLLILALGVAMTPGLAHAGIRLGIGIGIPIGPWPYYGPYPYPYYAPYGYPAAPVVVQQPVVVPPTTYYQSAPTVIGNGPAYSTTTPPVVAGSMPPPPPAPLPQNNYSGPVQQPAPPMPVGGPQSGVVVSSYDHAAADAMLQKLGQPDENVRRDAIMELARMKADRAVDSLISVLVNDPSPVVRDAAARALGLIGSHRAMNALIRATLADSDREVRRSAQNAVEYMRSQIQR